MDTLEGVERSGALVELQQLGREAAGNAGLQPHGGNPRRRTSERLTTRDR